MTHESTDFNQNDIKLKNISENLYKCEMEIYENSCCVFIFRSGMKTKGMSTKGDI